MAYCNNNPINWRDPFGLDELSWWQDPLGNLGRVYDEGKEWVEKKARDIVGDTATDIAKVASAPQRAVLRVPEAGFKTSFYLSGLFWNALGVSSDAPLLGGCVDNAEKSNAALYNNPEQMVPGKDLYDAYQKGDYIQLYDNSLDLALALAFAKHMKSLKTGPGGSKEFKPNTAKANRVTPNDKNARMKGLEKHTNVGHPKNLRDAAKRMGLKIDDIVVKDGVGHAKIRFSNRLPRADIDLLKRYMKGKGACSARVRSGYVQNEKLLRQFNRIVDKKPRTVFGGASVVRIKDRYFVLIYKEL